VLELLDNIRTRSLGRWGK